MENKNTVVSIIAVVALVVAGIGLYRPTVVNVSTPDINVAVPPAQIFGASGQVQPNSAQFLETTYISSEGDLDGILPNITTTTIPLSATGTTAGQLKARDVCESSLINVQLPSNGGNITFPSSSPLFARCLKQAGDRREFVIQNFSTGTTNVFSLVVNDQSSTLKMAVNSTSSGTGVGNIASTSSLNYLDVAIVTAIRGVSSSLTQAGSSTPWLFWAVQVFR